MNWIIDETEDEFIIKIKQLNLKKENFKLVRFGDYFEKIVIPSKLTYDKNKVMCSKDRRKYFHVPFYLATGNKHPDYYIHEQPSYVNTLNYRLIMLLFTGFCYEIDEHEFAINGHNSNTVLRCLNPDVNLMVTCLLLSRKFKTMFSWSKPAIFSRIKDENVFIYLNDTNDLSSEFKIVGVIPKLKIDRTKIRKIKFSDYFEKIVIPSKLTYDKNKVVCSKDRGNYLHVPFYLATGNKHPDYYIHEQPSYVNTLNYRLIMLLFTGFCYEINEHEFAINGHNSNTVLRCLNPDVNLMVTCLLLSRKFKTMFSWSKQAIFSRIKDENVFVYFN